MFFFTYEITSEADKGRVEAQMELLKDLGKGFPLHTMKLKMRNTQGDWDLYFESDGQESEVAFLRKVASVLNCAYMRSVLLWAGSSA